MRDIRFRGMRLVDNKWVYGNIVYSKDAEEGWEAIIIPQENSNMYCNDDKKLIDPALGFERWYRVNVNTIGQYTGLKDKNGVEIYEGDVASDGKNNYAVVFHEGTWRLKRNVDGDTWWKSLYRYVIDRKLKIIGNIYENPELLKEGE